MEISIYAMACLTRQLNKMMDNNLIIEKQYEEFFKRFHNEL